MWELCMQPNYDDLYIPWNFKYDKSPPQTNIFLGNDNIFSIKPTVVWVNISEKTTIFLFWDLVTTA